MCGNACIDQRSVVNAAAVIGQVAPFSGGVMLHDRTMPSVQRRDVARRIRTTRSWADLTQLVDHVHGKERMLLSRV